jgi:hypothetical protein
MSAFIASSARTQRLESKLLASPETRPTSTTVAWFSTGPSRRNALQLPTPDGRRSFTKVRLTALFRSWEWLTLGVADDISTLLPSASPNEADGPDDWRSLSISSPDFFTSHPPRLVGGIQLFFKGVVLLGRASMMSQRKYRGAFLPLSIGKLISLSRRLPLVRHRS